MMYSNVVQIFLCRRGSMAIRATYSSARANFARIWDEVESSREPAVLERRGHESMVLLPAEELSSLRETAHLLRSPKNAARLLSAIARSRGRDTPPVEIEALMEDLGISD